jgi:hypothetical protein
LGCYNETQGLIGGPWQVKPYAVGPLMARSSK